MMNNANPNNRDEVLYAFDQACSRPTAKQIVEWTTRFPQYADDIRAHAAVIRDCLANEGQPVIEPDETMLTRGFSAVMDVLYHARNSAAPATSPAPKTFDACMRERNMDVRRLARELDIDRGVLADLVSGRMLAPVRKRFSDAVSSVLALSKEAFDAAHTLALASQRLVGHLNATHVATAPPRKYEDIIRDSSMSDERKRFWLEEE